MFEDVTVESIKAAILTDAGAELETREGSFLDSMAGPAALEIWKVYQSLSALVSIAFPDDTSGGYLDIEGAKYGITRKSGTKARAVMTLSGTAGTVVPAGTVFLTSGSLEYTLLEAVALTGGADTGTVEAAEVGDEYNVEAGTITQMVVTIPGLSTWTNAAAEGGTDQETDDALYLRIEAYRSKPATSGNAYHYEQWALEVDGVGKVQVLPLADGPGTVTVLVADSNLEPAVETIVDAVAAHIEEERPIGAAVTVAAPEALAVAVAATVTIDGTTDLETVQAALEDSLSAYLKGLVFDAETILYNRVAYLLLSIDGVTDYSALTVNGGTANVSIPDGSIPVLGEVTVI